MMSDMERFDWNQVEDYWRTQADRAGMIDDGADPDALGNVCHAGAPIWLNEYYARFQTQVFDNLLAQCGPPPTGARALDVGCGAGRWCRSLASHGYQVEGIDLQPSLIERNRLRYPEMRFHNLPIQDFQPDAPFDLVSTVTVIQHIPFAEQEQAIARIASMLRPGGHVLALENVNDQGIHVFARGIEDWKQVFARHGLETKVVQRYDYSPMLRLSGRVVATAAEAARRIGVIRRPDGPLVPEGAKPANGDAAQGAGSGLRHRLRGTGWLARRIAVRVDEMVEPFLIRRNVPVSSVHCGFLFRKR